MVGSEPSLFRQGPPAWARLSVLLLLALSLMVIDARWSVLNVVRQSIAVAVYPFQFVMLLPRDAARQLTDWLDTAARIRAEDEADQLRRIEMAHLATYASRVAEENSQLRRLLGVSEERVVNEPVLVELLYESRTHFDQRLIIDKGSRAGIVAGNPLIDEQGLVGQVVRAGALTSEVALITDKAVSVPVQVLRNGLRAIAFAGADPGKLELRFVPADADILVGDLLVTSGIGGWFSAGVPVARVEQVDSDQASGYAQVVLQPLAGLERNRHFLVLRTRGTELGSIEPREDDDIAAADAGEGA